MDADKLKHVLFIGGHDGTFNHYDGLPFRFTCIQREASLGPNLKQLTDRIHMVDELTMENVIAKSREIHESDPVDYIMSFTEDGLLPSATAAATLGVPGIDLNACRLCIDKSLMRDHLRNTRFSLPFKLCRDFSEARDFLISNHEAVIFKPLNGAGSAGVFIAYDEQELREKTADLNLLEAPLLAETYLDGRMFSVETLTIRGHHEVVAITAVELEEGTFVPIQHILPAPSYPDVDQRAIRDFCLGLLDCIKYKHGPCHIEIKVRGEKISLIEINNRVGGDLLGHLAHQTQGVNMFRETIQYLFEGVPDVDHRASEKRFAFGSSRSFRYPVEVSLLHEALVKMNIALFNLDPDSETPTEFKSAEDRLGPIVFTSNSEREFNDALASIKGLVQSSAPAARDREALLPVGA